MAEDLGENAVLSPLGNLRDASSRTQSFIEFSGEPYRAERSRDIQQTRATIIVTVFVIGL